MVKLEIGKNVTAAIKKCLLTDGGQHDRSGISARGTVPSDKASKML